MGCASHFRGVLARRTVDGRTRHRDPEALLQEGDRNVLEAHEARCALERPPLAAGVAADNRLRPANQRRDPGERYCVCVL
jgi:hypothetical protein